MRNYGYPIVEPLTPMTKILHWIVALLMIGMLATGIYMEENEVFSLYPIHKSIGVIALVFILWRVIRRLVIGWPTPVSRYQAHEQILSKLVHWVLLIGTLMMPVSGIMMSGFGGHGIYVFGIELLPTNYASSESKAVVPLDIELANIGHQIHGILGKVLIGAIVLHVLGALKHHFMDKDNTLRRMLGLRLK